MKTFVNSAFCWFFMLIALMTVPAVLCEGSGKAELFFNSAVEEYLNENYESALKAIRESIELDPENERTKSFAIKLLLQMAAKAHLENRREKAMKLLEEARGINPHDERVNKLCLMIQQEKAKTIKKVARESPLIRLRRKLRTRKPRPSKPIPQVGPELKPAVPLAAARPPRAPVSRIPAPVSKIATPPPADSSGIIWKLTTIVLALILIFAGAAFIYSKQTQDQLLKSSFLDIQEMRRSLKEERMQIKKDRERMEKELKEQAIARTAGEKVDAQKRMYREAREQEERARWEAREREERERSRLEEERPLPKEISRELLVNDAREAARKLDYKNLVARLSAFKHLALQLKNIYELDKEKAVDFIKPLLEDPNPSVRVYLAGGVSQLPIPGFVSILFQLWKDNDVNVRGEALRGLVNFHKRSDFASVFPEHLQVQIKQLVEEERRNGKWVF